MIINQKLNEIRKLCCENNSLAQKKLYEFYYAPMISICMQYCKNYDDAIEVLNSGFTKIFNNINKFSGNDNDLFSWIYTIMVNSSIDKIRHNLVVNKNLIGVDINFNYNGKVDNEAISNFGLSELLEMIESLPKQSRSVFNLYVFDNYSHKEIAKLLNISVLNSQSRLLYARKALQQKIIRLQEREMSIKY